MPPTRRPRPEDPGERHPPRSVGLGKLAEGSNAEMGREGGQVGFSLTAKEKNFPGRLGATYKSSKVRSSEQDAPGDVVSGILGDEPGEVSRGQSRSRQGARSVA